MRTFSFLLAATLLVGGSLSATAQTKSQAGIQDNSFHPKGIQDNTQDRNGILLMKDGKMLVREDGKWVPMTRPITTSNGSVVSPEGTVTLKDGTKTDLKNDQAVGLDGRIAAVKGNAGMWAQYHPNPNQAPQNSGKPAGGTLQQNKK